MTHQTGQSGVAPSIDRYACVGDCRTAALISDHGSLDWLCLPNFSDPSVFARILDADGGSFSLTPIDLFSSSRRYLPGTAVLETTFETRDGVVVILDCLPIVDGISSIRPMREVLRIVQGISGRVRMSASIDPRPDYGRATAVPRLRGRLGWAFAWGNESLQVQTSVTLAVNGNVLNGSFVAEAGTRTCFSLAYVKGEPSIIPALGAEADGRLASTVAWWADWSKRVVYDGPFRDCVVRSAITLKLLSFAPSGAIVAAPTTSLPEVIGGERNWDYRYCWLRDAGLTMQAMVGVGIHEDATAFLGWLLHATRLTAPRLKIMYDVYGRSDLDEQELGHLRGYLQSSPVRIGNGAHRQEQLDTYGEVLIAAHAYAEAGGHIDRAGARMLRQLGKVVQQSWRNPDSGIWEIRGPERHYTFSKVMCWAALDRLIALDAMGSVPQAAQVAGYRIDRDAIRETIEHRGFNVDLQAYTGELDGTTVDASLLLMSAVGYAKATEPRVASTFALIDERLQRNGLIERYERGVDGMDGDEGAFGICTFWAIEQLAQRGLVDDAEARFVRMLSRGNDLCLFSEETNPDSGEALGNFPQAFTHVGLINSALAIEKARRTQRADGGVR